MSGEETIARINASGADFVLVALGARKGQAWIERNRSRLAAPVISHLGAVVNFVAGTVNRAPRWMQRSGLEWLWRIREEPGLWRRYWNDGIAFLALLFGRVLPFALWRRRHSDGGCFSVFHTAAPDGSLRLAIEGAAPENPGPEIRAALREAAARHVALAVDCSRTSALSPMFFGLLLMLKKHQDAAGHASSTG
jgi:N-acetylglucosaminyldiphosphoundecaprenol N-acetyl-beta-D-mannosaminyltransferase